MKRRKVVLLRLEEMTMQSVTPDSTKNGRIGLKLWWVGLLAIIASVAANVLVRLLAVADVDWPLDNLHRADEMALPNLGHVRAT
jgi:hypothetical protein